MLFHKEVSESHKIANIVQLHIINCVIGTKTASNNTMSTWVDGNLHAVYIVLDP